MYNLNISEAHYCDNCDNCDVTVFSFREAQNTSKETSAHVSQQITKETIH